MRNLTYHNNAQYGSPMRPVAFTRFEQKEVNGVEAIVFYSDREFFDELRYSCQYCHVFWATCDVCLEWGISLPVYLSDDGGEHTYRLESKIDGFTIYSDQIQPFCDYGFKPIKLTACYDEVNEHVTIDHYFPRHKKCNCKGDSIEPPATAKIAK